MAQRPGQLAKITQSSALPEHIFTYMATYKSELVHVSAAPEAVYERVSDLRQLPQQEGKITSTADTLTTDLPMVGALTLRVTERVPHSLIKLTSEGSPLPITITLSISAGTEGGSDLQLALEAPLNPFMQAMVEKPIKEALGKMTDKVKACSFNSSEPIC